MDNYDVLIKSDETQGSIVLLLRKFSIQGRNDKCPYKNNVLLKNCIQFFFLKINNIHSFKLIQYNFVEYKKDETVNKLTTSVLIA